MILDNIKNDVKNRMGKKSKFIFHGLRNQNEIFEGVILKLYPMIFLVELSDGQKRTYSYNDVLISNLEIFD